MTRTRPTRNVVPQYRWRRLRTRLRRCGVVAARSPGSSMTAAPAAVLAAVAAAGLAVVVVVAAAAVVVAVVVLAAVVVGADVAASAVVGSVPAVDPSGRAALFVGKDGSGRPAPSGG